MSEEYNTVNCCSCGIKFKFPEYIEKLWRKSGKTFYCPNGCTLTWTKNNAEKEIESLQSKVKELQTKLDNALKDVDEQKKKVSELTAELEIWRPISPKEQENKHA